MIDELERLAKLWQLGALTDTEFAEQKQRLFASQADATPVVAPSEAAPVAPFVADSGNKAEQAATEPQRDEPAPSFEPETVNVVAPEVSLPDDAAPVVPLASVEGASQEEPGDVAVDDSDAMLDAGLADLPPLDDAPEMESASFLPEPAVTAESPPPDADVLSFDDLDAMLDAGLADLSPLEAQPEADLATAAPEPQAPDNKLSDSPDLLVDDLDAMLDAGLADLPPLDDAPAIEPTPLPAEPVAAAEAPPADAEVLSFDDLDAMLDAGLADLPPIADDATAPAVAADVSLDDLNDMLDAGLADLPAVETVQEAAAESPQAQASQSVEAIADDLLFDDLNAVLDAASLAEAPPPAGAPTSEPLFSKTDDLVFDDLDFILEAAPTDAAPEEKPLPQIEGETAPSAAVDATAAVPDAPAKSKKGLRFKFGVPKVIGGILAKLPRPSLAALSRLPQPVLMGLAGAVLFLTAMGVGVTLAMLTASDPEAAEKTAEDTHETTEQAEPPSEHAEQAEANIAEPAENMAEPQLADSASDVLGQCAAINSVSEAYGTTLAESQRVPIQSLKVVAGSGHIRTDAHAADRKSCIVTFGMKSGPRQCKVDAVVRFPDGDVGAHVGTSHRVVCEGDAGFELDRTTEEPAATEHHE